MDQRQEERLEKLIALGLGGGAATVVAGFLLIGAGAVFQAGFLVVLGFLVVPLGVIWLGASLWSGIKRNQTQFEGPPTVYEDARIVSRAAYDDRAQLVFSDDDMLQEGVRFYVKIELAAGNRIEFECAYETFFSCGEGSRGNAMVQGKWLSQFVTTVGAI